MSIYRVDGSASSAYGVSGVGLASAYNIIGNLIYSASWEDEITVQKLRDAASATNYYVIEIPQIRSNGQKQYPFVFVPNGSNGATLSALTMMHNYGWYFGMNAGVFDLNETGTKKPYLITIEDETIIDGLYYEWFANTSFVLTINDDGVLGYADKVANGTTAQGVLNDGAVSAVTGFIPIVVNGVASSVGGEYLERTDRGQRQVIGQFANGNYCIITAEGRNFDNSTGFTALELQEICVNLGLYFAFMLDGGGSTETVIGDEQINTIYEGTYGRLVPSFIVFNGTDEFFIPNA